MRSLVFNDHMAAPYLTGMTDNNKVQTNLPTFQEVYRSANKAYNFIIYDAREALDQVLANAENSGFIISEYSKWCEKELNSLKSEIESGMYENCQTSGLREIEHSLEALIEAFQQQEEKRKLLDCLSYHKNEVDNNMLTDYWAAMSIG